MKVFFDGGCRPNPGEMETAVVARAILHHQRNIGIGSSEQAEWLALLHALEVAKALRVDNVVLLGDSVSVIDQVAGVSTPRSPEATRYLARFGEEAASFTKLRVKFIRRTQNLAGIAIERARNCPSCADRRAGLPD